MAASRKLTTSSIDRGRALTDFLAERLGIDTAHAASLVRTGAVYVGRLRATDGAATLDAGQRVTVYTDGGAPASQGPPPVEVVYQDADVIVLDKPCGVPSQASRERAEGALDRSVAALDPAARLFHRLDRDASGLVLFTRSPAAHRRFAALLADRRLERLYQAVVSGHLAEDSCVLDLPIGRHPHDRRRMQAGHGRPARTQVRVLRRGGTAAGAPATLVELSLDTGRTHQIRVHLAQAGHPLLGDALYGAGGASRLCLHATRLSWPGGGPASSPAPPSFAELVGCAT